MQALTTTWALHSKKQNKLEEAIEAYNKALVSSLITLRLTTTWAMHFKKQNKLEEAIEAYNKAIASNLIMQTLTTTWALHSKSKVNWKKAIEACNKALVIKPDYEAARTHKLHQQAHICNWDSIAEDVHLIPELGTSEKHVPPFALLSLEDSPDRHLTRSKVYAKAKYPQKPLPPKDRPSKRPKRIRIGYFSTDFKEHPVAYLIAKGSRAA